MTNAKTFRLFISSTFSDFNQERRLLQTYVFPEIKKYCRELGKGDTFQPIDLRWGVSNEAQLDQKALELCIEEVQSSKSQPHPNFLIMAGNRYGWVPLPYAIEQKEFEAIRENVEDTTMLNAWYKLDNNQLPASYILQQRSGEYEAYDAWVKVENSLREILQEAVNKTPLSNVQKEKYFTSATEAEVIEGIFGYKTITSFQDALANKDSNYPLLDSEHIFGYIRDVKSVEDDSFSSMFSDGDVTQANHFQDELRGVIKQENLLDEIAHLTKLSKDEKNGSLNYSYEAIENEQDSRFVTTMIAFLKRSIESYEVEEASTPQKLEENEQERFKEDKLKLFIGREEPLKAIQEYIENDNNQPLVIYGPSGMGKSALMAKAIDETTKEKIYRFVGSTASLTSSEQLVISILKAFGIEEQIRQIKDEMGQEKPEPIEAFYLRVHDHLKNIPDEKVIFIDAVDQLTNEDEFIWLPSKLPSNLKIIISALEDDTYPEDTQYFTALKKKTSNLYKLENFEESETLIRSILERYDRSITDTQLSYLQTIYQDVNTPLYLTIAAQEMRHWSSEDLTIDLDPNGQGLAPTQKNIIKEYIENLTKLYHHDEELVKRVLSYLYLANGLSEAELLELLSTDKAFVEKMAPETYHYNITTKDNVSKELPVVIWARLHTQLKEFIRLEEKNGQETMSFFHREFNDSISHQKDIQVTDEELIALVYKLIEKYQDEPFESNRWGELYLEIAKNYYIAYEFSYEYKIDSKFKEYAEALSRLENETYQSTTFELISSYGHINSKSTICFILFYYYPLSKMYSNDPDRWAEDYTTSLMNLAFSYKEIGQTEQAITLQQEALEITKAGYSNDPDRWAEDYTRSLNNLALSYGGIGQTKQAITLEQEALEIRKAGYSNDPDRWAEDYTRSLSNLATYYSSIGQTKQAITLEQEALEIRKAGYSNDPDRWAEDYTSGLSNLATYYSSIGQTKQAITLGQEALEIKKAGYSNDPDRWAEDYTASLSNLATYYSSIGQTKQAITLQQEALEITKAGYSNDPDRWAEDYTRSLSNLAFSYGSIGQTKQAITLEQEALEIRKALYDNNPDRWAEDYTRSLINLAFSYGSIGQTEQAITLEQEALEIRKALYDNNPDRWAEDYTTSLSNLAFSYGSIGQTEQAITLEQEALEIRKALYDNNPDRWAEDYTTSLSNLALSYKEIGQTEQAITLQQEALEITKALYSNDPDRWAEFYTTSLNHLALSYKEIGQTEQAITLEQEALEIRKALYDNNPDRWAEDYTTSLSNLAFSYKEIGQTEQAITLEQEALEITKALYSNDPDRWAEDYTRSLNNLAYSYGSREEYEKAESLYIQCFEIREKTLGEAHYDTLDTLHSIADTYIKLYKYKEANYYSEKYFKTIDFNDYINDITMFIYLFIKWYQFVQKENDTPKIGELNEFAKNTIAFYREKLGSKYNETIQREYDGYIELKDESSIEKTKIFQKIFIDDNNDSDIK